MQPEIVPEHDPIHLVIHEPQEEPAPVAIVEDTGHGAHEELSRRVDSIEERLASHEHPQYAELDHHHAEYVTHADLDKTVDEKVSHELDNAIEEIDATPQEPETIEVEHHEPEPEEQERRRKGLKWSL